MATLNDVITKLNESKVAKAGDTLSGSYQWYDSAGRTLRINKTDLDIAIGYDFANKQGGLVVCRSNTYGTANNNSFYDGAVELLARSGDAVSGAVFARDGSFSSRGIAFSINSVGSNYIRFDNGVQIVFDTARTADSTDTLAYYYTFPKPFIDANYICVTTPDDTNGETYDSVFSTSATQVKIKGNNARWHRLICFGFWK